MVCVGRGPTWASGTICERSNKAFKNANFVSSFLPSLLGTPFLELVCKAAAPTLFKYLLKIQFQYTDKKLAGSGPSSLTHLSTCLTLSVWVVPFDFNDHNYVLKCFAKSGPMGLIQCSFKSKFLLTSMDIRCSPTPFCSSISLSYLIE